MEVVEVSPPYDVNDNTAQLACRVILDALGSLVVAGKLGHRDKVMSSEPAPEISTVRKTKPQRKKR
jgi:agmatinase